MVCRGPLYVSVILFIGIAQKRSFAQTGNGWGPLLKRREGGRLDGLHAAHTCGPAEENKNAGWHAARPVACGGPVEEKKNATAGWAARGLELRADGGWMGGEWAGAKLPTQGRAQNACNLVSPKSCQVR